MATKQTPITLLHGDTYSLVLRIETDPIIYTPITGIAQSAPLSITVPGHQVRNGQNVAVTNVRGMTEVNGPANALKPQHWHPATVVDANTVELNDVNGAGFQAYLSGGILQYSTLMDLTGWDARLQVRNRKGGDTTYLVLDTASETLVLDTALRTVTIHFDAYAMATAELAGVDWRKSYYDLELFRTIVRGGEPVEQVYSPLEGPITLGDDTTR